VGSRLLILVLVFVCVWSGGSVGVVVAKARWLGVLCHGEDARGRRPTRIWTMLSTLESFHSLSDHSKDAVWQFCCPVTPVFGRVL
jgi:hypothetical protein